MKRITILLFLALLVCTTNTNAQDLKPTFCIRFGGHLTNVNGKDLPGGFLVQDIKVDTGIVINVEISSHQISIFNQDYLSISN